MKNRIVKTLLLTCITAIMLAGCGNKSSDINDNTQTAQKTETEVVEIVENATSTESEDGNLVIKTDTGEQIVIDDSAEKTENEDGSVTYITEDGKKVEVDSTGQTTVTTESTRPVQPENNNSANTEKPTNNQPAHTHSYTTAVTKKASCKEKGVKTLSCSCGDSYTEEIATLPHTAGDWETTKEATCTADGTKAKKCSVCGTQTETATITKTGHSEGSWETTKAATCKAEGTKVKKCTTCGTQLKSETIAKTGHTPGDWIVTKEATCSANGSKHKVCTTCGVETAVEAITSNGSHNYSWSTNGNTRTLKCACGATGITEYKYGSVWGYFDDAAAEELWGLINNLRNNTWVGLLDPFGNPAGGTYVSSLNRNNDLFAKAKRRAPEVALNFSHNGEQHECLMAGVPTAHEAKDAWVNSDTHCRALTDPDYTIGGVACFWYDSAGDGNCYPIWVFELGY